MYTMSTFSAPVSTSAGPLYTSVQGDDDTPPHAPGGGGGASDCTQHIRINIPDIDQQVYIYFNYKDLTSEYTSN